MSDITQIHTERASAPHGHYAQAVENAGTIYVSGLLGNSREEHIDADRNMEIQVRNCLIDLSEILRAAGSGLERVLQVHVFVSDIKRWGEVNDVWKEYFGEHKCARAVIPCPVMRYGSMIEITAIAVS